MAVGGAQAEPVGGYIGAWGLRSCECAACAVLRGLHARSARLPNVFDHYQVEQLLRRSAPFPKDALARLFLHMDVRACPISALMAGMAGAQALGMGVCPPAMGANL